MRSFRDIICESVPCGAEKLGGAAAPEVAVVCSTEFSEEAVRAYRSLLSLGFKAFLSDADTSCSRVLSLGRISGAEASERAYEMLDGAGRGSEFKEGSYAAYADSGWVAVAADKNGYTSFQPMNAAIDDLLKSSDTVLEFFDKSGPLTIKALDLISEQRKLDEIENEEKWAHVREVIGDEEIYLSFRNMMETIFAKEAVPLLASFYDPATGLFYTSRSGKEADGIYPIPEGTSQALGYIASTGMLRKLGRRYVIPELSRHKIIYYLKSIQGEDGEFYVAQMRKDQINSNRIGRDRVACTSLLWRLGASPTYTVGTYKGDGVTADEYWAALVKDGVVTENDKPHIYWAEDPIERKRPLPKAEKKDEKPTGAGTEQFQSHLGFIKWLLEKDAYNQPYSAMSATSSAYGLISDWNGRVGGYEGEDETVCYNGKEFPLKKGDTLYTILIRWLDGNINEAGLFGKVTNEHDENGNPVYDGFYGGWGYQNSNGFLKGVGRYTEAGGIPFPKPKEAAESLLKGIASDEVATDNILVIYNVWSSLNKLRMNISNYFEGDEREELLSLISGGLTGKIMDERTGTMRSYAAVAIDKCLSKLLTFRKRDGGFAHSIFRGTGCWQGGLKVANSEDNLSDIDAINCSTSGLGRAMCQFFGLDLTCDIPMYTEADLLVYLDTLYSQKHVIKKGPMGI
ncbi:MAG: hypothetical protein IJY69_03635 [Clostridia bacterium]|nr:hypothetical protein [Clostridia bacterium]